MTEQIDKLMNLAWDIAWELRRADFPEAELAADELRTALEAALKPGEPVQLGDEWASCVKLPITVHVRKQRPGEQHVSTREGITPVRPDDLIMRGVAGEEYPIGRELFQRTYRIGAANNQHKHLWRNHDQAHLSTPNQDHPC